MEEVITMKKESYDEVLHELYQARMDVNESVKDFNDLALQVVNMKQFLLTVCLDTYKLKHYEFEKVTNYESWEFGLDFKHILLQWFTIPEMVEFVEKEWGRLNA